MKKRGYFIHHCLVDYENKFISLIHRCIVKLPLGSQLFLLSSSQIKIVDQEFDLEMNDKLVFPPLILERIIDNTELSRIFYFIFLNIYL